MVSFDYRIISVQLLGGYRLRLEFDNGGTAEKDMAEAVAAWPVFKPLVDPARFAEVFIGEGGRSLEWPGDIGLCADALWFEAHPQDYADFLRAIPPVPSRG
jgi:hypothetical protein